MDCIFCDIINRKAEAEIIFEDEKVIAFLDIKPIHFGHILIVPKTHCADFIDVPEDESFAIMSAARIVAAAMVKSLKPDAYNIFANNGKAAGQSVFHFHLHITPRYHTDEIHFKINLKKYSKNEMKVFADKIKFEITTQEKQ